MSMLQKQISVFIENKRGRLAQITKTLGDNGVDLGALSIADTADYGVLRLIVDKPGLAEKILKDGGYAVSITDVIAISVDDRPGGLAAALEILDGYGLDIEYMYHYARKNSRKAAIIVRVDKPAEAVEKLAGSPVTLLSGEDLNGVQI